MKLLVIKQTVTEELNSFLMYLNNSDINLDANEKKLQRIEHFLDILYNCEIHYRTDIFTIPLRYSISSSALSLSPSLLFHTHTHTHTNKQQTTKTII